MVIKNPIILTVFLPQHYRQQVELMGLHSTLVTISLMSAQLSRGHLVEPMPP